MAFNRLSLEPYKMTAQPQYFIPARRLIQSISNANPGVVVTTQNHGYHNNLYVRLNIPIADGMQQATGNVYLITVLSSNSFSINQDTTNFATFSLNSTTQSAQVIPIGSTATNNLINAERNDGDAIPEL